MFLTRGKAAAAVLIAVAAIIVILYLGGHLDSVLYRFGLNHNPCTHSVSGGTVCGPGIVGTPYSNDPGSGGGGGGGVDSLGGTASGVRSSVQAVGGSVSNSAGSSASSIP